MRFRFAATVIDTEQGRHALRDPAAGGYASFEGWVRDAFEALALKEGERIIGEAAERFPIRKALCIHRIGALAIGELAVWVGVSAVHRGEAFDACRYIIDEVKHRLPIWKKEHYENGDSGWVNCERCATAPHHTHTHDHDRVD
jgi:molybdopterin synthase catalytic subunit